MRRTRFRVSISRSSNTASAASAELQEIVLFLKFAIFASLDAARFSFLLPCAYAIFMTETCGLGEFPTARLALEALYELIP